MLKLQSASPNFIPLFDKLEGRKNNAPSLLAHDEMEHDRNGRQPQSCPE